MSSRTLAVLTTVDSLRQARLMARTLVGGHLAACAHIAAIESFYHWEGRFQQTREFRLTLTTAAVALRKLRAALRALHPYELPAIDVLAMTDVHPPYARWVERSCAATLTPVGRVRARAKRTLAKKRTGGRR